MTKMIVIGAAGFIGSNLIYNLVKKGFDVLGIDDFSTGYVENIDEKRFSDLPGKFEFRKINMHNTKLIEECICSDDIIFLLAAHPRVQYSTDFPVESNFNNVNGVLSVLEAAKKSGAKRVVYSASSSMYGGQDIPFPTPESTNTFPKSNYALQKYVGLEYCRLYSSLYGLDTCSLIYFNVFGPLQRADSAYATVVPAFFDAAINNKPCRIDGDGTQSRDMCYVDNVVQANILAAEYTKKLNGERFNIACGEFYSVNDVFETVRDLVDNNLQKISAPSRVGDPQKSHADISKAHHMLGYKPIIKFKEGMKLTSQWWLRGCPVL